MEHRLKILAICTIVFIGIVLAVIFVWLRTRPVENMGSIKNVPIPTTDEELPPSDFVDNYGEIPNIETRADEDLSYYQEARIQASLEEEELVIPPPPPAPAPAPSDRDRDGLTDEQEATRGTNPDQSDTDGDGLSDLEEVVTYRSDPMKADTDNDGFNDGQEVKAKYNPLGPGPCVRETCIP